jgi:hypothetical protein
MADSLLNKYRAAIEVLQRGRDVLVEGLADEILAQDDDLIEGGYRLHEFLETQGTRLHFLTLMVSQLEQSAEALEERALRHSVPQPPPAKRRPRARKVQEPATNKEPTDEG